MSRAYFDTNFLYGLVLQRDRMDPAGRAKFISWLTRVEAEIGADPPVISALSIDEVTYRLALVWLRHAGDRDPLITYRKGQAAVMKRMRPRLTSLWKLIDQLGPDLAPSSWTVVQLAQELMTGPGLAPRDSFHAAYAIAGRCRWIVSSDPAFDRVDRLDRLGPPAA